MNADDLAALRARVAQLSPWPGERREPVAEFDALCIKLARLRKHAELCQSEMSEATKLELRYRAERDVARVALAHAQADAEQAIHTVE